MKLLILNGPSINLLGIREKEIYGYDTYEMLVERVVKYCEELDIDCEIFQSNYEGTLLDKIQEAYFNSVDGIVFNPGAYTHTSIALYDCLKAVSIDTVEVHLTDISKREPFRQISYIKDACLTTIMGKGIDGYIEAIDFLKAHYESKNR